MEKFKAYGSILLGILAFFILATYGANPEGVETYRWVMTTCFGFYFVLTGSLGIKKLKDDEK